MKNIWVYVILFELCFIADLVVDQTIKAPSCPCGPEAKLHCVCCVKCNTHTCMGKQLEWEMCNQPASFCYTKVHVQATTKSKSIEKGCMNNTFVPTTGSDNALTWKKPIKWHVMSDIKGAHSVILQWTWYACRDRHYCNGVAALNLIFMYHLCIATLIYIYNSLFE